MEFWSLLMVASMPVLEVLLAGLLGAFLASSYINILTLDSRRAINKIVFVVFIPALVFASLAKTVTLKDIVSWWFMPVNIGITFLIGGVLGWVAVKIIKPDCHIEGLVVACCSAGNLGTLPLIIIPAICNEEGNPFGEAKTCNAEGLSYVSLSMALGNFFIWTHTCSLIRKSALLYEKNPRGNQSSEITYKNNEAEGDSSVIKTIEAYENQEAMLLPSFKQNDQFVEEPRIMELSFTRCFRNIMDYIWEKLKQTLKGTMNELLSPPTLAAIVGFVVGAVPWLKDLIVGEEAPLRVLEDSLALLGDGTVPCTILILGGNLTEGLRNSAMKPVLILVVVLVRFAILPFFGIAVVTAAGRLGFLPNSSLYCYVLLVQFILPPAMSIGTMAQLFDVCREECSVMFSWTYLVAAFALTIWSMVFIWILS